MKEIIANSQYPFCPVEDVVLITNPNGIHKIVELALGGVYHLRYQTATISFDGDDDSRFVSYYIVFHSKSREEFLAIVKEEYPDFFEYLLYHPEHYDLRSYSSQ